MSRNKTLLELATYAIAVFLCILTLVWVARLWNVDFSVPLCFESDALFYQTLVKGLIENGWVLHNPSIGMPTGLDLYDLPMADNLQFALIKLISFFAPNSAATLNVFALLTFPLITITTLLVFRQLNLSRTSSVVGGLLYTFLPYHFLRLGGHTLLSAYYSVPLVTLIILWAFSSAPIFFRYDEARHRTRLSIFNRRALISIAVCLVVASSGVYYAFFACFFLVIVTIFHILARHKRQFILSAILLIAIISCGVVINLLPNFCYTLTHGPNIQAATRSPADSENYGLKITQLVLPSDYHRIAFWRRFKTRYNISTPLSNENSTETLGIIGCLGFFLLLAHVFLRKPKILEAYSDVLTKLSLLNLSAILLATIGGFGSLFAFFVSPQIRAYNRMSVYISLFGLMAFFLSFDALFKRFKRTKTLNLLYHSLLLLILIAGVLDQTPSFFPTGMTDRAFRNSYQKEAEFIHEIEAMMPSDAMIFQLPYVPCPENPPVNKMKDYDHLRAYLHSKSLRWSYGTIKGRMTDGWQKAIVEKPVEEFVAVLSLSGFSGIYVDRFGYTDMGAELETQLFKFLALTPLVSPDKRLVFFDMSRFNKKSREERERLLSSALFPVWGEGFSYLEVTPQGNRRWCTSEGKLYIYNLSNREKEATLEMGLATGHGTLTNFNIESPAYSKTFKIKEDETFFSQTLRIPPGFLSLRFRCDARRVTHTMDPRPMVFRVMNFRLTEVRQK